ncbi:competence type IV pilus minor pilin ComGD [Bacillus atrophaeus]|uniref:competence type IV pilus minor pilin ComGD n=1 Tax=Bacillus atrophaeus TaxID=1452 RepID=UPI00229BBE81|nr:GspH/FimT family protein [Bacillus atrophaeus]
MKINIGGEKGFTLLESLLVLCLTSVMLICVFTVIPPVYKNTSARQTVARLESDILLAQQTAISNHERVRIVFLSKEHKYQIIMGASIVERTYEDWIFIECATLADRLDFNEKGNPNLGGKIRLKTDRLTYEMTVYLGSGKINVERK